MHLGKVQLLIINAMERLFYKIILCWRLSCVDIISKNNHVLKICFQNMPCFDDPQLLKRRTSRNHPLLQETIRNHPKPSTRNDLQSALNHPQTPKTSQKLPGTSCTWSEHPYPSENTIKIIKKLSKDIKYTLEKKGW